MLGLQSVHPHRDELKAWLEILQALLTCLALVLGGLWFYAREAGATRANLSHRIEHHRLTEGSTLLAVTVSVRNPGDYPLRLRLGEVRVQQVLPLPVALGQRIEAGEPLVRPGETTVPWPEIATPYEADDLRYPARYIRPGEVDSLEFHFVLRSPPQLVRVYSYFSDASDPDRYWIESSFHPLEDPGAPSP